jgi:hypothetical protein
MDYAWTQRKQREEAERLRMDEEIQRHAREKEERRQMKGRPGYEEWRMRQEEELARQEQERFQRERPDLERYRLFQGLYDLNRRAQGNEIFVIVSGHPDYISKTTIENIVSMLSQGDLVDVSSPNPFDANIIFQHKGRTIVFPGFIMGQPRMSGLLQAFKWQHREAHGYGSRRAML